MLVRCHAGSNILSLEFYRSANTEFASLFEDCGSDNQILKRITHRLVERTVLFGPPHRFSSLRVFYQFVDTRYNMISVDFSLLNRLYQVSSFLKNSGNVIGNDS